MAILSPFELLNLFEKLEPGKRTEYYLGSVRYDRGEDRFAPRYLELWKLVEITRVLEKHNYAILSLRRLEDFKYIHYIQKRSHVKGDIPEWISAVAEVLEHKKTISGYNVKVPVGE